MAFTKQSILDFGQLEDGKRMYFASDFHLGIPNYHQSRERETKIIKWLDSIEKDASGIFLLGDVFDFWFEYKHVIPKGFVRFQSKIASLSDRGIKIYFFTGNHDLWMNDYLERELGVSVIKQPISLIVQGKKIYLGHGDGLGPGNKLYKIIKKILHNPLAQKVFYWLHPSLGFAIARAWSRSSRMNHEDEKKEDIIKEKEFLYQYCLDIEKQQPHNYYMFGHRHLTLDFRISSTGRYINLGEWLSACSYAEFDGNEISLKYFKNSATQ